MSPMSSFSRVLRAGGVVVAAAGFLIAAPARATVMQELSVEQLVGTADAVVRGVVLRTGVRVAIVDGQLEPQTHTWIQVDEWLAGRDGGRVIELWETGGKYGDVEVYTSGTPEYKVGEEVVAFLRADGLRPGLYRTHEMAQGKYSVVPPDLGRTAVAPAKTKARVLDPAARLIRKDLDDVAFATWNGGKFQLQPATTTSALTLGSLMNRVRTLGAAKAKAQTPAAAAGGAR